ncbi:DUF1217 domain-containing protein [Saliniramus sp.]|uniref:DUF1217 domain-containing protein n=1 Tax=Saliniramus sp. TaxID=2986772 RepID=UPI002B720817|nr:DUF1217 domain-containing protein [Saliniramus sp.]HMB12137.1 DUF1217 domain-containing protein [Saliniramus sp.]
MLSTPLAFNLVARDLPRSLERTAQEPMAARDIAYFEENIGKIRSIDDFMSDERIYRFALKAHGLEDMAYARAFIRKALEEGTDERDSFANRLADKRYRDLVETFNFKRYDSATTSFSRAQSGTVEKFVRQTLEVNQGAQNEGVRLALYFERKAPGIENVYEILADPALLKVVQTALGLSPQTGGASVEQQAAFIESRLDIADFKDPEALSKFLTRFTSLYELDNPTAPASAPNILIGGTTPQGIGINLLTSIQSIKRGGF